MCKWSHLNVGDRVTLVNDGDVSMCNSCGGPSGRRGERIHFIYCGHNQLRRYGICDLFEYVTPYICATCGTESEYWADPCGGISSWLFEEELVELPEMIVVR